ncbi:hypothetical protein [Pandoraea terrigena]|uniref:Uncharacterized protein n=1 Tax=Pandoraea terrigena TaxID=2508292 RepID=A0A5E4X5P6_9BURK|nr:hypothetical protein [Pandoraea terrigena]VVE31548.1 hypothetical protein PTE31013_03702 [Pandoraea terrigena]
MNPRPAFKDDRRRLTTPSAPTTMAAHNRSLATATRPALPALPAALPLTGYVVWFYVSLTYLDIRFDHDRFEIVTQQVPRASDAFYFDSVDAAYGHAAEVDEPYVILGADAAGAPAHIVG